MAIMFNIETDLQCVGKWQSISFLYPMWDILRLCLCNKRILHSADSVSAEGRNPGYLFFPLELEIEIFSVEIINSFSHFST